jgi:predicted PurR-regulated permease PerM
MASPTGTVERRSVQLSAGAAFAIVGGAVAFIVAQRTFVAAHRPLSWAAASLVAAVLLDPVVDRLSAHVRRVPAVLLTFLVVGGVGFGTTYLVFDEVQHAVDRLRVAAPDAASAIEDREDRVGELARDFDLAERVDDGVATLDRRVAGGDAVLRNTAGTAPAYLVCTILTIFFMTYGPRLASGALNQQPDPVARARIAAVVGPAVQHTRSAVLFAVTESLFVALAVGGVAAALDLPAPSAIGFAAGVLSLFPYVGITLGAIPLLLMTLGFRSLAAAAGLLVVVLALQVVDSLVLRPRAAEHSVDLGLLVPWVVALLAYAVYGVGAAAYGAIYAVFGLAILDRLEVAWEAGVTGLRGP